MMCPKVVRYLGNKIGGRQQAQGLSQTVFCFFFFCSFWAFDKKEMPSAYELQAPCGECRALDEGRARLYVRGCLCGANARKASSQKGPFCAK